jgi:preprotein translocase subunit SecY
MFSMTAEGGEGTLRYKKDQRRRIAMVIGSVLLAIIAVGAIIFAEAIERGKGDLSPTAAILLVLLFVAGFIASNWVYLRNVDELEWANNVGAAFWALMILVMAYPTWLVLWLGGLVREPSAYGLYMVTMGSAGAIYIWKRLRQQLF